MCKKSVEMPVNRITVVIEKRFAPLYMHWGSVQAVLPIGGVEV